MDDSERYRKQQDLVFQEMEEKEKLQQQAIREERAQQLLSKMKATHVGMDEILEMMDAGRKFNEIIEFLDSRFIEELIRGLMAHRAALGRPPITEEEARERVTRVLESD